MMHTLSFLAVTLVAIVLISACWSAELMPSEVARTLDITSFPNSIRPGLRPGTKTLAENGFTEVDPTQGDASSVEVYQLERSWLFKITVRRSEDEKAVVCILDQALNDGTYLSLESVELQRGEDGLLHATGQQLAIPAAS